MSSTVQEQRAAAAAKNPGEIPAGVARLQPFAAELRVAELVEWNGQQRHQLDGIASTTNTAYRMWDFFGEYDEIVDGHAFDETLAAEPDVAFLVNHRGVTMARSTGQRSLELSVNSLGLVSRAYVNPERQDVRDLVVAIKDRDITEMSFAFRIDEGEWNDDFTEFRIKKVDLHRGDVSAVNYGANPYTSIAARSCEILAELEQLPPGAARAALMRLQARADLGEGVPRKDNGTVDLDAMYATGTPASDRLVAASRELMAQPLPPSKLLPPVQGLALQDRSDLGRSIALVRTQWMLEEQDD